MSNTESSPLLDENTPLVIDDGTPKPDPPGKANVWSSIFNMVNTIIGGGMLALPFAFKLTGLVLGIISVVVVAGLSGGGRPRSYRELAMMHYGRPGLIAVEILQILFLLGTCTGYIVIVGDVLGPFAVAAFAPGFNYSASEASDSAYSPPFWAGPWGRVVVQLVVVFLIPVPLSFLKRINLLSYTSMLSIACIAFLIFSIVFRSIQGFADVNYADKMGLEYARWTTEFFRSIPIISFAFTFQMQLYAIWAEMKEHKQVHRVVLTSLAICGIAYLVVGIFGYLSFLAETQDNILKHYEDDVLFDVGKVLLALIICFSYPLMSYPLLAALDQLFFPRAKGQTYFRRIPEALALGIFAFGLAIAVPDISVVFGYIGATVGNILVYILPAAFYLSTYPPRFKGPGLYKQPLQFLCFVVILVGFGFMIASLYAITADLVKKNNNEPSLTQP